MRVAAVLTAALLVDSAAGLLGPARTGLARSPSILGRRRAGCLRPSPAALAASEDLAAVKPETVPIGRHVKIGGRVLTPVGLGYLLVSFGFAALAYVLLVPAWLADKATGQKANQRVDRVVRLWAWLSMQCMGYRAPKVEGLENLPDPSEAVMVVPNHTSFLDILTISAFVPRNLKYISKVEILRLPFVGWAMRLANHIAIRRDSRTSQIRTLKEAIGCLEDGNSLVTFAEGTRSRDGRLASFKKGPFTMAKRAKTKVLPVSISGLHRFMPPFAIMPITTPTGVTVRIHPPVETVGRSEDEVLEEVRNAVASGLPKDQLDEKDQHLSSV